MHLLLGLLSTHKYALDSTTTPLQMTGASQCELKAGVSRRERAVTSRTWASAQSGGCWHAASTTIRPSIARRFARDPLERHSVHHSRIIQLKGQVLDSVKFRPMPTVIHPSIARHLARRSLIARSTAIPPLTPEQCKERLEV